MIKIQTYIYKKKHKSGNISFVVRYKAHEAGKWVSVSAGSSKQEALLVEAKIRQEMFAGINPKHALEKKRNDVTISEIIDIYYKQPRYKGLGQKWRETITSFFENRVKIQIGKIKLSAVTREHVYKLYRSILADQCSNATLVKYHHQLNVVFNSYCELHPEFQNPILKIKISEVAPKQSSTRAINFLIPEEIENILLQTSLSTSKLLHPFIQFLANTGMRRSEALNLRWTDIDEESGFFIIRTSKTKVSRSVPIEERALSAILPLRNQGEFVFSYPNGKRPDAASFLRAFKRNALKAGIKKRIDLHTLRHSYGSNKIRLGWGLKKVSKILGHMDIQMTASVYSHLLDGDLKVQDELIFGNPGKESQTTKIGSIHAWTEILKGMRGLGVSELTAILETHQMQLQKTSEALAPHMLRDENVCKSSENDRLRIPIGDLPQMNAQAIETLETKKPRTEVLGLEKMVEVHGFEPRTPCLQSRCSTN